MGTMLTELESAINNFIEIYHKYSLEKGNYHALYRDDLKKLLLTECPQYMKVRRGWGWPGSLPGSEETGGPWSPMVDGHASALTEIFTLCFFPPS